MKRRIVLLLTILVALNCVSAFLTSCTNNEKGVNSNMERICDIYTVEPAVAEKLYPAGYNFELAKKKGLAENSICEEKYLLLQACYRAAFNCFLNERVSIDRYQERLDSHEYVFPKCKHTAYAAFAAFGRNNIFLRNTLFVERLTEKEIHRFLDAVRDDSLVITDDLLSIVEETWKSVIFVKLDESYDDTPYEIVYDEFGVNKMMAYNDALVLEIAYDPEYDSEGEFVNRENEPKKYEFILSLAEQMESEISESLGCHVAVIVRG